MRINKHILSEIIRSEIVKLINEKLSSRLFHFCPLSACYNIIMSNSLFLSSINQNNNDKRMNSFQTGKGTYKTYPYYMCFSRTFSTSDGYVRTRRENTPDWKKVTVRFEFDGDLLNNYFPGKAVNAFMDPESEKLNSAGVYYSIPKEPGLLTRKQFSNPQKDLAISMSYEHEDRLFSTEKIIKGADKFIKEIDILLHPDIFKHPEKYEDVMGILGKIFRNHTFGHRVQIYSNEKAFNSLNIRDSVSLDTFYKESDRKKRNSIDLNYNPVDLKKFKSDYSGNLKGKKEKGLEIPNKIITNLSTILSILAYNGSNFEGSYKEDALALAKKCGLKNYLDKIEEKIPNLEDWGSNKFLFSSQMCNSTLVNLRTVAPDSFEKLQSLIDKEEENLKTGLFYGKGKLHKKIYGF